MNADQSNRIPTKATLLLLGLGACGGGGESSPNQASPNEANTAAPETPAGPVWFEETAAAAGLTFRHQSGASGDYLMPEIMSTGAALLDVNGDGHLDAYLVQGGNVGDARDQRPGNRLYLGRGDGTFQDATDASGAGDTGYGMGVTTGDYDGDGHVDLYVSNLDRNTLLRNNGDGTFRDVTEAAGVGGGHWSASAAFVDPDGDGDLDLFVTNYIYWSLDGEIVCKTPPRGRTYCSPKSYDAPAPDEYFENQGDGTFVDASLRVGLRAAYGNGLGIVCADFDLDGAPEIFVANDGTPNQLWDLQPDGTFKDSSLMTGCSVDDQGRAKAGMGVAAADVDADGDEDLLVVNLTGEDDSFYRNDGGQFVDRTPAMGLAVVSRRRTRFGVSMRDFDLDGFLDVYQANGRVAHPEVDPGDDPFAEENTLLRGSAKGRFREVRPTGGVNVPLPATSRAAAFGDIDGDGDVDILVHNKDGAAHLLRNVAPRSGAWAGLDVRTKAGSPALGASLLVTIGGRTTRHEVRSAESYCAASSSILHLGLGEAESIESVVVRFPGGSTAKLGPFAAGAVHTIRP